MMSGNPRGVAYTMKGMRAGIDISAMQQRRHYTTSAAITQ